MLRKFNLFKLALVLALTIAFSVSAFASSPYTLSNTNYETTILSTLNKTLNLPGATASSVVTYNPKQGFANGTGTNQANIAWHDERTLSASANESLQITTSGALKDALGGVINFTAVKLWAMHASCANTNTVVVGNGTNPFAGPLSAGTATITLNPCDTFTFLAPASGWAVTASSNDVIKVVNGGAGTSVTYDIYLLGVE